MVEKQKSVNKIGHGQYYIIWLFQVDGSSWLWSLKNKTLCGAALHELDPAFRRVTLENKRLKDLVTDLKFHKDPVGADSFFLGLLHNKC